MGAARARVRPRKLPVQRRSRQTVDAILRGAARVLVRRGWAGMTTNHVAVAAGVSIGSLYEYFPGKEALVLALAERHLDAAEASLLAHLGEVLPRALALPLGEVVRALVSVMVALHAEDPRLHRALFEVAPRLPELAGRVRRLEEASVRMLEGLLRAHPEARVRDAGLSARLVVELVEALTHRWVVGADGAPVAADRMADELAAMVTGYLRGAERAAGGAGLAAT
ncbi:TetR/AcrR family transcriptional regulator [Sorangium sp. So ce1036]|uniref:TetR/AcrR family transcriptional regulator n=1 Tax=Sorangium sp. So ce1036 TaxID=3133328 RepID=UPI003F03C59D